MKNRFIILKASILFSHLWKRKNLSQIRLESCQNYLIIPSVARPTRFYFRRIVWKYDRVRTKVLKYEMIIRIRDNWLTRLAERFR